MSSISIYGAGSWGTALAVVLANAGKDITLWARNSQQLAAMQAHAENRERLPGVALPANLKLSADFSALARADIHIIATPMAGLRVTAQTLQPYLQAHAPKALVWLCKGLEPQTWLLPHQVINEVLPGIPCAALSGPSFADEAARALPFALVCAAEQTAFAQQLVEQLHTGVMRLYSCADLVGVEIAGAVKNVMAIATGIADGLQLGLNARAALITRGLAEITRLGIALGAQRDTFMGLAGMGDLILTCTGDLSRNRRVGLALAQGQALQDIVAQLGAVAEGVLSAPSIQQLAQRYQVEMPITDAVCQVLFHQLSPRTALQQLLARGTRSE